MTFAELSSLIIPLIIAITLHEAAHGFAANMLGDSTAKRLGRVTLDPLKHVDAFGTLLLPAMLLLSHAPFLFGYAKPVPVNFNNLRHPRRDTFLVAFAGPGMNLLLSFISALLFHLQAVIAYTSAPWMYKNFGSSVTINVVLAVFNMLPILPLDGGRVLNSLLPPDVARYHARTERWGMVIVILLFMVPPLLHMPSPFGWLVAAPAEHLIDFLLRAAGIADSL